MLEVGRKRCFENKPTVEEPPAKRGMISAIAQQKVFQKHLITVPEQKKKLKHKGCVEGENRSSLNCKWK